MKVSTSDCLAALRLFGITNEEAVPREISRLSVSNPSPINTAAVFRFRAIRYAMLFDETAHDRASYIEDQLKIILPAQKVTPLENPKLAGSYSVPFEGKDCYLALLGTDKQRLDSYIAQHRPELSRSSWQKHIRAGFVLVNGSVVISPKFELADDDTVSVKLPEAPDYTEYELPILYLDDDVIVINKPIGVLTHGKNQLNDEFTVADFFRRYTSYGLETDKPGIVHRLDRDTSGVMIGARTERAFEHLKQQFADRTVHKTYVAVTDGIPDKHAMMIDLPIARNSSKPGSFRVDIGGKSAQTSATVMSTDDVAHALIRLEPRTGRTHQLRVHLAHLNLPIHGYRLYGKPADRLYLHAHALQISLPDGTQGQFQADIPESFLKLGGEIDA